MPITIVGVLTQKKAIMSRAIAAHTTIIKT